MKRTKQILAAVAVSALVLAAVLALAVATSCAGDVVAVNGTEITNPSTAVAKLELGPAGWRERPMCVVGAEVKFYGDVRLDSDGRPIIEERPW